MITQFTDSAFGMEQLIHKGYFFVRNKQIMETMIQLNTVDKYNKLYGLETLHPLVGIVDLTKSNTEC